MNSLAILSNSYHFKNNVLNICSIGRICRSSIAWLGCLPEQRFVEGSDEIVEKMTTFDVCVSIYVFLESLKTTVQGTAFTNETDNILRISHMHNNLADILPFE